MNSLDIWYCSYFENNLFCIPNTIRLLQIQVQFWANDSQDKTNFCTLFNILYEPVLPCGFGVSTMCLTVSGDCLDNECWPFQGRFSLVQTLMGTVLWLKAYSIKIVTMRHLHNNLSYIWPSKLSCQLTWLWAKSQIWSLGCKSWNVSSLVQESSCRGWHFS